jgi:hypothetical protein
MVRSPIRLHQPAEKRVGRLMIGLILDNDQGRFHRLHVHLVMVIMTAKKWINKAPSRYCTGAIRKHRKAIDKYRRAATNLRASLGFNLHSLVCGQINGQNEAMH